MKELINFSNYQYDSQQFTNIDKELPAFLKEHNLQGIELLIGYEEESIYPKELIHSVHLPFWVTWLDVWNEKDNAISRYFDGVDKSYLNYMCGGETSVEMTDNLAKLWINAKSYNADYAVMHACHVELEHAFDRRYTYSNMDVLKSVAALLNSTAKKFPAGEPPITLGLENLWWPGLTFLNHKETLAFMEMLEFDNWHFVLDTGHLFNATLKIESEARAIDFFDNWIHKLPQEIYNRIKTIHLSYSGSMRYQKETMLAGVPENFNKMRFSEKYTQARNNASNIDKHHPFSSNKIYDCLDQLNADTLVHEFLGSLTNKSEFLRIQKQKSTVL
ncbi:MAG: sugar phosphate isomerase/epimerase [Carboxylicivirga sp.]|nr:sugar phosphate isomerase/epimerase [Carboxylicivirga sp.]